MTISEARFVVQIAFLTSPKVPIILLVIKEKWVNSSSRDFLLL